MLIKNLTLPSSAPELLENPGRERSFVELMKNPTKWKSVPLVSYSPVAPLMNGLVRFRGIITDMFETDTYLESCLVRNIEDPAITRMATSKYQGRIVIGEGEKAVPDFNGNSYGERHLYSVTATPYLNEWVIDFERAYTLENHADLAAKVQDTNGQDNNARNMNIVAIFYLPQTFKLHDAVDLIGFLAKYEPETGTKEELCIHVVVANSMQHINPLLDERMLSIMNYPESLPLDTQSVGQDLHSFLTLCLGKDSLAGKYLLFHLISSVFQRRDNVLIGTFALNMIYRDWPADYPKKLHAVLEQLLPASHYCPLSIENLSSATLAPSKNYETDRLVAAQLQVAAHTHIILDETVLSAGKLSKPALDNIKHLTNLIESQKVYVDFKYYVIGYDLNAPVLTLSYAKSMLPTNYVVPLEAQDNLMECITAASEQYLHPINLSKFRRFITESKNAAIDMDQCADEIPKEFCEMRKKHIVDDVNELHWFLAVSRYGAITSGKSVFTKEDWDSGVELEKQRRERIKVCQTAKRIETVL